MMKILFIIFLLGTSMFYSCTSDIIDDVNSSINTNIDMTLSNSLDQINAFDNLNIISDSTTTIITASILPKGHLFEDSCHGYASFEQGPVEKTIFAPEVAKILGVEPYVLYLFRRVWVTTTIHFQSDADFRVFDRPSPECGLLPASNYEIGYTSTVEGTKFIMTTILYYIQTHVSGQTINKWAPKHINDLVWNYAYYFP